jgi:hypothetical protein
VIKEHWKRIAAVHCPDEGEIAAVWLAHDGDANVVHLYDCALFKAEVLAVTAEGLNARGRWIPIAWEHGAKPIADELLKRGCRMQAEPVKETPAMAEVTSREIQALMRTGRFRVDKRLAEWLDEYRSFYRQDAQVPRTSYPLMSATRLAVADLQYARAQAPAGVNRAAYPKTAIV